MPTADVVVIGAGIVGAATTYYLAKAGVDVLLIDRRHPNASGAASQACAGGVRQQGRVLVEIPLAIYAIELWSGLENELDADIGYRRDGMTIVTDEESLVPVLADRVARERAQGLDIRMVYGRELKELIPGLSGRALAGSYCPTDGQANPMVTIDAFVTAARRYGARVAWACPATGFATDAGCVTAVLTPQGAIPCRQAVLAAGYWSRALAATVGLELPLQAFPLQMMVTARTPRMLEQVLGWSGHGISLKQVPTGGFVIGGGWPGSCDPETYRTHLLPGSMAKNARTAADLFPSVAVLPVVRGWVGIEAFCSDEKQIVGPAENPRGLVLAAGFSGHGFGIGPGVGSLVAAYVQDGALSDLLAPFGLGRFGRETERKES